MNVITEDTAKRMIAATVKYELPVGNVLPHVEVAAYDLTYPKSNAKLHATFLKFPQRMLIMYYTVENTNVDFGVLDSDHASHVDDHHKRISLIVSMFRARVDSDFSGHVNYPEWFNLNRYMKQYMLDI